jgi:hypothetical protein
MKTNLATWEVGCFGASTPEDSGRLPTIKNKTFQPGSLRQRMDLNGSEWIEMDLIRKQRKQLQ